MRTCPYWLWVIPRLIFVAVFGLPILLSLLIVRFPCGCWRWSRECQLLAPPGRHWMQP